MTETQRRLLKAKISLTLLDGLSQPPTNTEVERFTLAARVLYKAVLGLLVERKEQKRLKQLAIF